jgi:hypothetical protein
MFKSNKQVFCRWCGKRIAKHATHVNVREEPSHYDRKSSWNDYIYLGKGNRLRSKTECQKHTNQKILSVSYRDQWIDDVNDRYVSYFNIWDGESYVNEFFCSGTCAQQMGRAAAAKGFSTKAWRTAQLGGDVSFARYQELEKKEDVA